LKNVAVLRQKNVCSDDDFVRQSFACGLPYSLAGGGLNKSNFLFFAEAHGCPAGGAADLTERGFGTKLASGGAINSGQLSSVSQTKRKKSAAVLEEPQSHGRKSRVSTDFTGIVLQLKEGAENDHDRNQAQMRCRTPAVKVSLVTSYGAKHYDLNADEITA